MEHKVLLKKESPIFGACVLLAVFSDSAITYVPRVNTVVNHIKTIFLLALLFYFLVRLLIFVGLKLGSKQKCS